MLYFELLLIAIWCVWLSLYGPILQVNPLIKSSDISVVFSHTVFLLF